MDAGHAKLSDFGLATDVGSCEFGSDQFYIPHAAPECYTQNQTSVSSDIYAVGLTLFRLLNNIDDWRDICSGINNLEQVVKQGKLIKKIGYQSHIPRRLKSIVNKACQIDPEKRFSTAKEMRQALEKLKLRTHWYKKRDNEWVGQSMDGRSEFKAYINRQNKFVFERNKRKITSEERKFQNITQAQAYLNMFIAENTLE